MRTVLSTYSLSHFAIGGTPTQLETIGIAKSLGYQAVEICEIWPHDGSSRTEYAKKLKAECDRLSMPVAAYVTGSELLACDNLDAEIERVCGEVDIAEILGAPKMRHDVTTGYPHGTQGSRSFATALPVLAAACEKITRYAAEKNIRTMVENHGQFFQDPDRVESLITTVAHPNFGLLIDIGNFTDADVDPIAACSRLAPYAIHVHAKDFHMKSGAEMHPGDGYYTTRGRNYIRGAVLGHGNVPVVQCLSILRQAGCSGDVTVEFEGIEDPVYGCKLSLEYLNRVLAAISADI